MKKIFDTQNDHSDLFKKAEADYTFQEALTKKLDNFKEDFDEKTILEIVLWKTNRYPHLEENTIQEINGLKNNYTPEKARLVLSHLLNLKGFDLPMASTVLRFADPNQFQIIDQRVYRFITPGENQLKIPHNKEAKIELYFKYIDCLKEICSAFNIAFNKSDRILYQLDKTLNRNIPIKY